MFKCLPILKSRKAKRSCVKISSSVPHENPVNSTLQREKSSQAAAQKPWVVFTFENQEHPLKKKNNEISHSDTVQKEESNNGPKMLFPIVVVLGWN